MKNIEVIIIHPSIKGHHFKAHECQGICTELDGVYSIMLLQTKRWFDEHKFSLIPGDILSAPETSRIFTVANIAYKETRPKYAIITATLIDKTHSEGGLAS